MDEAYAYQGSESVAISKVILKLIEANESLNATLTKTREKHENLMKEYFNLKIENLKLNQLYISTLKDNTLKPHEDQIEKKKGIPKNVNNTSGEYNNPNIVTESILIQSPEVKNKETKQPKENKRRCEKSTGRTNSKNNSPSPQTTNRNRNGKEKASKENETGRTNSNNNSPSPQTTNRNRDGK
eukprot:gene4955-5602_t